MAELVRAVHFEPVSFMSDSFLKNGGVFKKSQIPRLESLEHVRDLNLESRKDGRGPNFNVATIGNWCLQAIYWESDDIHTPGRKLLDEVSSWPGFNAGYRSDAEDVFWQSVTTVNSYQVFGKPYDHLPKVYNETMGEYDIDISMNPGRRTLFPGMWLQSAWQMWFGPGSFRHIARERLLTFPHAHAVKELENDVIFVELYENGNEYDLDINRARQQAFRDWVGMDTLEEQAPILAKECIDPTMEMFEGEFPHGGIRFTRLWLDGEGNRVQRSRATHVLESELGPNGTVVWRGEVRTKDEV